MSILLAVGVKPQSLKFARSPPLIVIRPIFSASVTERVYITAGDCQRVGLALRWNGGRSHCPGGRVVSPLACFRAP